MTASSENHVGLLIRNATVDGGRSDIAIADGVITAVAPSIDGAAFDVFDAEGGAVIPGLHDHHIHLLALAAARQSIAFSAAIDVDLVSAHAVNPPREWLRVTGYHESIVGEIDRAWLDERLPDRPVRVQHRSGVMWVLNSAALTAAGIDSVDGRLLGADELIRERVPHTVVDMAAIGSELAGCGVTGVTDLTPTEDADEVRFLATSIRQRGFPLEVMITGGLTLDQNAAPELRRGPVKIVVGDHDLPMIDELVRVVSSAHRMRRCVAVHCVTRVGLLLALAAWQEAGAVSGDRIEHGAVIPLELIDTIVELGLTVVTQPSFVRERGDRYLADVDADDVSSLWRCGSLIDAGVRVGGSTDAPFGDPDPWRAIATATHRLTSSGEPIGLDERIAADRALQMFLTASNEPGGAVRRIAVGEPAELCILRVPLAEALLDPSSSNVAATYARRQLHPSP